MSSTPTEPHDDALPAEGDLVTATITEIGEGTLVVTAHGQRWPLARAELTSEPRVGESLEVFIDGDPGAGKAVASRRKAETLRLWDSLSAAASGGAELEGEVVGEVKGGLSLDVGLRAFMPASQTALRPLADLRHLVGQRLRVRVLELDQRRGRLVVSHRAVLEAEREKQREQLFETLHVGDVVKGRLVAFVPYGAFVDLGCVDGLLRLEDMSWAQVKHGGQLFSEGEELTLKVLDLDKEKGRVGLGVKQLREDPWRAASSKYAPGARVTAKVLRLAEFGAFVELEPDVEGLVHVSEMRWGKPPKKPGEVVHKNQVVQVEVLDVDVDARRIALGMRQLTANPWRVLREKYHRGAKVSGVVRSITDFGAFLELETGVDGLLHASDMSWTERVRPSDRYKIGDTVEVALLDIDVENERIALGVKQLTPDPWLDAVNKLPPGAKVTGKVTRVAEFGVFIEIAPGVEGLCHVTELTDERDKKPAEVTKVGDELTVVMLDADPQSRRVALSLLAAEAPPAPPPTQQSAFANTLGDKLKKLTS